MSKKDPYAQVEEGTWVFITKRAHRLMCCSCALVHDVDYREKTKGWLEVRYRINRRATAAARKAFKFEREED